MIFEAESRSGLPIVVKIGGSLITNKSGYCELNSARVIALGEEIAALEPDVRCRLIVVLGGGSFSHGIALRYGLKETREVAAGADLSRLTIGMFRMMATVIDSWRDIGVSAYPIQPATQVRIRNGELQFAADQFVIAMAHQMVPVTTGDIALLPDSSRRSLSGDWLVVLLAREITIASAVLMTDVPGVIDPISGSSLETISISSAHRARQCVSGSSHPDVSGGMAAKLEAALALAVTGVPVRIADGREQGSLAAVLLNRHWAGTDVVVESDQGVASC